LIEANKITLSELKERYYFEPIKEGLARKAKELGDVQSLNYLTEIMREATAPVEKLIRERIKKGDITSADQARKTIAGNGFQGLVAYSLIILQNKGKLPPDIAITLKPIIRNQSSSLRAKRSNLNG